MIGLVGIMLLVGCTTRYQELMNEGDEHQSQGRSDDAILSYEAAFQETAYTAKIVASSGKLEKVYKSLGRTSDYAKASVRGGIIFRYCLVRGMHLGYCHFPEALKEWPEYGFFTLTYSPSHTKTSLPGHTPGLMKG